MPIDVLLARGRVAAERLMVDACTIRRRTGQVEDDATGVITPTYATLYTGRCRVQQHSTEAQIEDVGEAHVLLLRLEVALPMAVVGLAVGDEVTLDTSTHDPDLVGRVFLVRELAHKTHATARRVQVQERTS